MLGLSQGVRSEDLPDEDDGKQGGENLEEGWKTPTPVVGPVISSKSDTRSEDGSSKPGPLEEADNGGSFLGVSQLDNKLGSTGERNWRA